MENANANVVKKIRRVKRLLASKDKDNATFFPFASNTKKVEIET